MNRLSIHEPLAMMERILSNTSPVIQSKKYFVEEKEDLFSLEIPVPGFSKADINIEIDGEYLLITGNDTESYWTGDFNQKFKLPSSIEKSNVKANVINGILKVNLGKKKESIPQKVIIE